MTQLDIFSLDGRVALVSGGGGAIGSAIAEARRLIATITAFTVAHSLTLVAATLGWVHVPGPPVEAAIALSIMFVAAEIVHSRQGMNGLSRKGFRGSSRSLSACCTVSASPAR